MDNDLESKLMAELDGIFAWAVLGLHRLMKNKRFTSCNETTEFIMKYRRYNNPVMAFVQDQCTLEDGYDEDLKELYKAYKSYCTWTCTATGARRASSTKRTLKREAAPQPQAATPS